METNIQTEEEQRQILQNFYDHAAHLAIEQEVPLTEVKNRLINEGLDDETASVLIEKLRADISEAKKEAGKKNMLYGALWCIGGTVLTVMDIGYIFWGAIVFGGFQFIKGLAAVISSDD